MKRQQRHPFCGATRAARWLVAAAALFASFPVGTASEKSTRPNIIFVLVDDLGWGDFSCFGNTDIRTPNIDRAAAEGIRFEQFYVNSPICSPSRCALLTGNYPQRWRITSYLEHRASNTRRGMAQWLDTTAPTLPRQLSRAGYATGHFGKWHLGGQRDVADAPPITDYGFAESLTNFEGMGPKLLPLTKKPGDKNFGRIWADAERLGGPVVWLPRSAMTGAFADAAVAFLRRAEAGKKPFYVTVFPDDVHSPFWPSVENWGDGSKRRLYLSVVEELDRQLGRLFNVIRNSPELRNNTLVLICSDNGPEPGAGRAGPFRGHKGALYEGGIRSPLIVWGPGLIAPEKAGTANTQSVLAAIDIFPSLLDIAGAAPPEGAVLDGENRLAVLLGKNDTARSAPVFWRRPPDRKFDGAKGPLPDLAVRDGDWKLLCDYDGARAELYALADDPGETANLAERHPDIAKRLAGAVMAWHHSLPADNGPALGEKAIAERAKQRSDK